MGQFEKERIDKALRSVASRAILKAWRETERSPRHPLQLTKAVGDIATGQTEDRDDDSKNVHAVELGKLGRLKDGPARAEAICAVRRSQIAQLAAKQRWSRSKRHDD